LAVSEETDGSSNDVLQSDYVGFLPDQLPRLVRDELKEHIGGAGFPVWLIAGGPDEYRHFCEDIMPICSGYIFFPFHPIFMVSQNSNHDIIFAIYIRRFTKPLADDGKKLMVLKNLIWLRPHKNIRQGSVTMAEDRDFRNSHQRQMLEADLTDNRSFQ